LLKSQPLLGLSHVCEFPQFSALFYCKFSVCRHILSFGESSGRRFRFGFWPLASTIHLARRWHGLPCFGSIPVSMQAQKTSTISTNSPNKTVEGTAFAVPVRPAIWRLLRLMPPLTFHVSQIKG
jgi:hypothetical protein